MSAPRGLAPAIVVVAALGVTGYAYLVDRESVSDGDRAERSHDVFPSFHVDRVRRVELVQDGGSRVVLSRAPGEGGRWTVSLANGRSAPADAGAVDALLRELELAKRLRDVPEGEARGLDAPRVRGHLTVGRVEYEIELGAEAPRPEGSAYMRVDGDGAFVVDRALAAQLLRSADAYRDRTLVPYGAAEVARLEVTGPQGSYTLDRAGSSFRVGGATGLRAARADVERIFGSLADARVDTFLDDAVADRALGPSPRSARVVPRDAKSAVVDLSIGGPCPGRPGVVAIARQGDGRVSACVGGHLASALDARADGLVDRAPFYARFDEVEELKLSPPDGPGLDLARRGSGWHERAPEERDLDGELGEAASSLAADVASARASEARAPFPSERIAARARASLTRTGTGTVETLEIEATEADGTARARRSDDGAILRLSRATLRRLEARAFVIRPRAIWSAPFDSSAVVGIESTCGPVEQQLDFRDGRWLLRSPAGFAADATLAGEIADAVSRGGADRWVAERDDGTFGFDGTGACRVVLHLAATAERPARVEGIAFGASADDDVYAKTLDSPAIFAAPAALRALASTPAIDRGSVKVDPRTVTRVTLVRGADRVTLERQGSRLVRAGADAGADERLGDVLFGLTAREAVHPGPPARSEGFAAPTLEIEELAQGEGGPAHEMDIVVGAPTHVGTSDAYFVRVSGVDATFAVPKPGIDAILGAW